MNVPSAKYGFLTALVAAGCGSSTAPATPVVEGCGVSTTVPTTPPPVDALAAVPCPPWAPSDADWSSLPTAMPAILATLGGSPSGRYIYGVGSWLDGGRVRRQILRSRDLGDSWCLLATPDNVTRVAPSRASELGLYAVVCDDAGSRVIESTDGGATWSAGRATLPIARDACLQENGVLETSVTDPKALWVLLPGVAAILSIDGGATWSTAVPPALVVDEHQTAQDFVLAMPGGFIVDPTTAARVLAWGWAAPISEFNSQPARWFKSVDAGQTWREIAGPPLPDNTLFAGSLPATALFTDTSGALYGPAGGTLLRSDDWGETWDSAGTLPRSDAQVTTLGSNRAGQIYSWLGGVPAPAGAWRTDDRGTTWCAIGLPAGIDPLLAPGDGGAIVGLGVLGLSSTRDGGATWARRSIVPLPSLVQSPVDLKLWAGSHRELARAGEWPLLQSTDGGLTWTTRDPVPGALLMDGANADAVIAGLYSSSGVAWRTEDGGRTWTTFAPPSGNIVADATCAPPASCQYVLSRTDGPQTFACALSSSVDLGRSWAPPVTVPQELCSGGPKLAVAPDDRQHLLAACIPWVNGAEVSAVCESRDGGSSWTSHPIGGQPFRYVESVLLLRDGVGLAATSTVSGLNVATPRVTARSTDGGATWVDVLADGGQLVASAVRPETVFLISRDEATGGNTSTVLRSDDGGATWTRSTPAALASGAFGDRGFSVREIADDPRGGFVATTDYGVVHFR